ncbi:GNAT family N-acetyltransferase [Pseudoalteromonas sp. MMG013]|uniref:GNAT family N-acetyltransferase n=1 Tax=unclassified Pseudoalteromonas TaxID=194690 RepID=UPI001B39473D|nr:MULTISPECIES: GNAT family N-acetyltransferase [unclassified Pseudoalteromonas]MBQ4845901.1 GNAT family N-acetyltransferase [Pseudoalteromonas sp. MMG005]MBQ4849736.1 GNAT family N-acetyltransferase [Pseudoalteromonas sp. MMG012]MBQ4861840.1 GNAT family N-acetyltransferase [Pseudoalteromonas sp. MMG013]
MAIIFEEKVPEPEEFCALRVTAGLSAKSLEAATIGLPNSLYGISIREDSVLIGMGRVVGDGACNFEVVDIAVDPRYQGQGLGRKVMSYIDAYLSSVVLTGSYVSMIADEPTFYEKLGYRLVSPASQGMTKKFSLKGVEVD